MLRIILAVFVILYYFGAFMCFACLLPEKFHGCRPVNMFLLGFMMYFGAFHLLALPMKLIHLKLHVLSLSWFGLLAVLLVFVLVRRGRILKTSLLSLLKKPDRYVLCFLLVSLALTILLVINVNHISDYDAGYYIGLPASSKFSDTIELMNPFSGKLKDDVKSFYQLNTDTVHAAVIYQILRLPPLVHAKFSFTAVLCMLFCMALYKAGEYLLPDRFIPVFGVLALGVLLFSYSLAGVSHYFAYRTYEGKAVCSYLYTTVIFICMLAVLRKKEAAWGWLTAFFAALSGVSFCNTALFIIPLMVLTWMLPVLILAGDWRKGKVLQKAAGVLAPAGVWLILYAIL